MYGIVLYSLAIVLSIWSFSKDRSKTQRAFRIAIGSFKKILPAMLGIVGFTGLLLAIVPPGWISTYLGEQAGWLGTAAAAVIGAITLIPGLVAFPLAGTIYREGASTLTVAAFISTLTLVGIVTLPAEIEQLGKRLAILRNGVSLVFALLIAVVLEVIL